MRLTLGRIAGKGISEEKTRDIENGRPGGLALGVCDSASFRLAEALEFHSEAKGNRCSYSIAVAKQGAPGIVR
jgi:hypothetical protein